MKQDEFLTILNKVIDFFTQYKQSHIARMQRFDFAFAKTRGMSKELTSIELQIIEDILTNLNEMLNSTESLDQSLKKISEYLNQASATLKMQSRNVTLAYEAAPIPVHGIGVSEAQKLNNLVLELLNDPVFSNFPKTTNSTWHNLKHNQGIDFTCMVLVPYLMDKDYEHGISVMQSLITNFETLDQNQQVHPIAANDDLHAYPKSFTPTFDALKSIRSKHTREDIVAALKLVEDNLPEPPPRLQI